MEGQAMSGERCWLTPFHAFVRSRPLRLASSLVLLVLSVLFLADMLGLRADPEDSVRESRKVVAEALAVQLSSLASIDDVGSIEFAVSSFVERSGDVRAAALLREDGTVLAERGERALIDSVERSSTSTRLSVPIMAGHEPWGEFRIVFEPSAESRREILWFGFVGLVCLTSFAFFLSKVLVQLDPGRSVPGRVDSAFDLFSSGVLILDDRFRIVMANTAAERIAGVEPDGLLGRTLDDWPWQVEPTWRAPWMATLADGTSTSDQDLRLAADGEDVRYFRVSCASVGEGEEGLSGVLVTLDDMTPVERKNTELAGKVFELRRAHEAIELKNVALEKFATLDALTGLYNRRLVMERLDDAFAHARREGQPLACIMCDIDHFKRINDAHGHAVGDDVIRAVADVLGAAGRAGDTIGRYGGEEFVLLLPDVDARRAEAVAERARIAVIALVSGGRLALDTLSSSFGVADLEGGAQDGATLLDQADQALYAAKNGGRNRVALYSPDDANTVSSPEPLKPSVDDLARARLIELETLVRQRERDIDALREFDSLTGMPMRSLFLERVGAELARADRAGTLVGLMSFEVRDLDRLVATLGHVAADALVVDFAERLQEGLRTTDLVTEISAEHSLSRITSNEYGVLLTDLSDAGGAMIVVTRLKRLLSKPFAHGDRKVYIGANIGIALSGQEGDDAASLFAQASEVRVEASAKSDKVSHGFASATLDAESDDYIRLESDLHDALEAGALEVYFQPKFDLAKRRVTGLEALLRWRHQTRGFISPAVFVAVAEANGLIGELSSLVLDRTLEQIRVWRAMGFDSLRVSVNVSPMQLRAESLVDDTLAALREAGVDGRQLEIELTETSVLDRPDEARVALEAFRAAGVCISMDDFGTGYTSLALLADLPLDTVKIDRSFIVAMEGSERSRAVVASVITMAHALNLRVVGEGIEEDWQLDTLAAMGCDEIQGYLISRPLPADEITAFLVRERETPAMERRAG